MTDLFTDPDFVRDEIENNPDMLDEGNCAICNNNRDECRESGCDAQYCQYCFDGVLHGPEQCDV